jgi:hypothetical protein
MAIHRLRTLALITFAVVASPVVANGEPIAVNASIAAANAVNDLTTRDARVYLTNPRYRAEWGAGEFRFFPNRGPAWSSRVASMWIGSDALATAAGQPSSAVDAGGKRIEFQRDGVTERYVLRTNTIEQQFVLRERLTPSADDLVIESTIATSGTFRQESDRWAWADREGEVTLGNVTVLDACGSILPASMAVRADRVRIVVDGSSLASAAYPVTIDPEIGTNDFRISDMGINGDTSNSSALIPVVAYNSANHEFLVVWHGRDNAAAPDESEVYGQRISAATGAEVGTNDFRISDMGPDNDGAYKVSDIAVAYNPTNNEYLVVWRGDDNTPPLVDDEFEIFGQRINAATGAEVGTNDFRVSNMGADGSTTAVADVPWVVYNSTNNEYLVVWRGHHGTNEFEIYGQRLSATGAQVGTNDFRISDAGDDGDSTRLALDAKAAYNSTNNEYLVVWQADDLPTDNEVEVFGQRLNAATGAEVGANDFRITDMGPETDTNYRGQAPAVAYNSAANEYLVVYYGTDNDPAVDGAAEVFGQRLNAATGAEIGTNDFRISDMGPDGSVLYNPNFPAIAYSPILNEYLVVWPSDDDTGTAVDNEFEIWGQRLTGAGSEVGTNDFRLSDMGPDGSSNFGAGDPDVAFTLNGLALIVWRADDNTAPLVDDESEIFGQFYQIPHRARTDVTADSKSDLLLQSTTGAIAEWQMNGSSITAGGVIADPGSSWVARVTGDFDGNATADLILHNTGTGELAEWTLSGFSITGGAVIGAPGTSWIPVATADFNGDYKADIVLQNSATTSVAIWYMNGFTITTGALLGDPGIGWQVVGAADFGGDGKPEVLLQNSSTGDIASWQITAGAISGGAVIAAPGQQYAIRAIGDCNGDGKADIFLQNTSTGSIVEWQMNGNLVTNGAIISEPGSAWTVKGGGDHNGDTRFDLILRNGLGDVARYQLNGFSITAGGIVGSPGSAFTPIPK